MNKSDDTKREEAVAPETTPSKEPLAGKTVKMEEKKVETPTPEQEKPKLIFGKYKTLEDAEKAYKELEHTFHKTNQTKTEEEDVDISSLIDEGTPDNALNNSPYSLYDPYQTKQILQEAVKPLANKIVRLEMTSAIKEASMKPGWKDYQAEVLETIKANPTLLNAFRRGDSSTIDLAYNQVVVKHLEDEKTKAGLRKQEELKSIEETKPVVLEDITVTPPPEAKPDMKKDLEKAYTTGDFEDVILKYTLLPDSLK